jgi:hypothetical protein
MDFPDWSSLLDTKNEVLSILDEVLSLGRCCQVRLDTALLEPCPILTPWRSSV